MPAVCSDTDVAIGSPFREADDAYALVADWNSRELRGAGISTTFGNAPLGRTTTAARLMAPIFSVAGENSVYPGAEGATEVDRISAATMELLAA